MVKHGIFRTEIYSIKSNLNSKIKLKAKSGIRVLSFILTNEFLFRFLQKQNI